MISGGSRGGELGAIGSADFPLGLDFDAARCSRSVRSNARVVFVPTSHFPFAACSFSNGPSAFFMS